MRSILQSGWARLKTTSLLLMLHNHSDLLRNVRKKSPHTWCRFTDSSTKILKCSKRFKNPRKAGQLTKDLRHYLLWVLSIWEVKGWRYRFCTGRHKEELMSWQNRYINKIIEFTCTGSSRSYYTEQTESLFSIGFSCLYSFCLRCSLPTFTT